MDRKPNLGVCHFCKAQVSKAAITRHLASCPKRQERLGATKPRHGWILQLMVQGAGMPQYWMVIEMSAEASLYTLDSHLRDVWLECCGHMSAFTIDQEQYNSGAKDELEGESMAAKIGKVVMKGDSFRYEYDFGTTTELILKVVNEREGSMGKNAVEVLATNTPPDIRCKCGEPATRVCSNCAYDAAGWLCDQCAAKHDCGEEMLLPVVNSPRVGMCAYTG